MYPEHTENLKTFSSFVFEIFNKILLDALGIWLSIYTYCTRSIYYVSSGLFVDLLPLHLLQLNCAQGCFVSAK